MPTPTLQSSEISVSEKEKVQKEANERFIRWQGIQREYLGKTIETLLALSTAALGFASTQIEKASRCSKIFLYYGIVFLVLSVIWALILTYFRLKNFRATTEITNIKRIYPIEEERGEEAKNVLASLYEKVDKLAVWVWCFFYSLLFLFGAGVVSVTLGYFAPHINKLWSPSLSYQLIGAMIIIIILPMALLGLSYIRVKEENRIREANKNRMNTEKPVVTSETE